MKMTDEYMISDEFLPGDIGKLIEIQSRYYFEEFGYGLEFEAYISKLFSDYIYRKNDREGLWKLTLHNEMIGSVALFMEDDETARMRLLFVHPGLRENGMGTTLVDLAIDFARKKGYSAIVLMTEDILEEAGKIYVKKGFEMIESESQNMWGVECQLQTYKKVL